MAHQCCNCSTITVFCIYCSLLFQQYRSTLTKQQRFFMCTLKTWIYAWCSQFTIVKTWNCFTLFPLDKQSRLRTTDELLWYIHIKFVPENILRIVLYVLIIWNLGETLTYVHIRSGWSRIHKSYLTWKTNVIANCERLV